MDSRLLAGVLSQPRAAVSLPEAVRSDPMPSEVAAQFFTLTEGEVDKNPFTQRNRVAAGIGSVFKSQFVLEGKIIQSAVFAASFRRCSLLWRLLLKELEAPNCPQRLLLKLQYCQRFCIQTFNSSPVDTKRSMVSDNAASVSCAMELSVSVIQGKVLPSCTRYCLLYVSLVQCERLIEKPETLGAAHMTDEDNTGARTYNTIHHLHVPANLRFLSSALTLECSARLCEN